MSEGMMRLVINGLQVNWDDSPRRILKPCVKCGKKTRGRTWGGGGLKKPSCIGCSIDLAFAKAKESGLYEVSRGAA